MTFADVLALPCWNGDVTADPLSGGLSNEIWKVTDRTGAHVVRFGVDYPFHHVNRARELMTSRAAHAAGFAPKVEYAAPGVMVTAFVEARTLTAADLRHDPARVANLLRQFHHLMPNHVSGEASLFWVFHVIRDYGRTLNGTRHAARLSRLMSLSEALETTQFPLPIIFGHNDLLPANLLDDGNRLWLIDYEYAGFSTALFDLAGAASNALMTPEQALSLLETYFAARPSPELLRAFDAMQCASLLRETLWALVSDLHLAAPGVDYAAYADDNLDRLNSALDSYQTKHGKLLK